jgi:excisionase family DNA binding protein
MQNSSNSTFQPPAVLTPDAFHAAIGGVIGKNRIYELLHVGRIRHVRVGSRFLILATETEAFFEREAALVTDAVRWSA